MKKTIITLLKYGIPLAIIVWLLGSVDREQASRVLARKENWPALIGGFVIAFSAISLSFVRWYLLVRILALPFRLADAFRLGFLGYLLTFVSGGSVGGDLFKAAFVAHEQPGRRSEAVATVLIDRVAGMVSLFLLTSLTILLVQPSDATAAVRAICNFTLLATAVGVGLLLLVLVPRHTSHFMMALFARIPKIGPALERMVAAIQVYRRRPLALLLVLAASLSVIGLCFRSEPWT